MRIAPWLVVVAGMAAAVTPATEWPVYGGDTANTRYSPLNQTNAGNVTRLVQGLSIRVRHRGRPGRGKPKPRLWW